jgi:hypothetical protein
MAVNAWSRTPLVAAATGRAAIQVSEPYYALARWVRGNTPADALLLVPFRGQATYYALRVYARRPLFLHYSVGEIVLVDPSAAARYYELERDIAPLWTGTASAEQFGRVARKYGVGYVVTERGGPTPPDWTLVYQNERFQLFSPPSVR